MAVIPAFKQTTMLAVVQRHVAPGSTVCTDGRRSYGAFAGGGRGAYRPHATDEDRRCAVTPSVVPLADRALGHLQQWLTATYHGVSKGQLQVYLDEFVFRHTRRRQPMAAFQTLLGLGSGRARAPYRLIRGAKDVAATD